MKSIWSARSMTQGGRKLGAMPPAALATIRIRAPRLERIQAGSATLDGAWPS